MVLNYKLFIVSCDKKDDSKRSLAFSSRGFNLRLFSILRVSQQGSRHCSCSKSFVLHVLWISPILISFILLLLVYFRRESNHTSIPIWTRPGTTFLDDKTKHNGKKTSFRRGQPSPLVCASATGLLAWLPPLRTLLDKVCPVVQISVLFSINFVILIYLLWLFKNIIINLMGAVSIVYNLLTKDDEQMRKFIR